MSFTLKRPNSKLASNAFPYILIYGALAAVLLFGCTLICHFSEYKTTSLHIWISDIFFLLGVAWGAWVYRKKAAPDQRLNTRQAYFFCVFCGVFASLLYGVFLFFYISYWNVSFTENYMIAQKALLVSNISDPIELLKQESMLSKTNPFILSMNTFLEYMFLSCLAFLLVAMAVRSER